MEIDVDSSPAENAAAAVRYESFKPIAKVFQSNVENAISLLQLPHGLLMWAHIEQQELLTFSRVYLPIALLDGGKEPYKKPEIKHKVDKEVARRMKEWRSRENFMQSVIDASDSKMSQLLTQLRIQAEMRMVLLSLMTSSWTAFEVLAGDAWEFILNSRADQIAQNVIKELFANVNAAEGLSAKGIPLWMAAKYKFDLRNHIGEILKPKIDFSDVRQVRKAYEAVFGVGAIPESLKCKNLTVLEKTRHLIVHRAGIVDERYNDLTNQDFSLGESLPLNASFITDLVMSAINAGCSLISFIDNWLMSTSTVSEIS